MIQNIPNIPKTYQLLYTQNNIQEAVKILGNQISTWCYEVKERTNKNVIALVILKGGIFFFTDLIRNISNSLDVETIQANSIGKNNEYLDNIEIKIDMLGDINGRSILLVDDVCESARTIFTIEKMLTKRGADVRSAVLVYKTSSKNNHYFPLTVKIIGLLT